MADIINLADRRAARKASRGTAREVRIVPVPMQPFDSEPWVIEFWRGIATLISVSAACINFALKQGER